MFRFLRGSRCHPVMACAAIHPRILAKTRDSNVEYRRIWGRPDARGRTLEIRMSNKECRISKDLGQTGRKWPNVGVCRRQGTTLGAIDVRLSTQAPNIERIARTASNATSFELRHSLYDIRNSIQGTHHQTECTNNKQCHVLRTSTFLKRTTRPSQGLDRNLPPREAAIALQLQPQQYAGGQDSKEGQNQHHRVDVHTGLAGSTR